MIYKKRQAGGPMPPQGMEGQMMPPNPQEQMAPPQGPPQGGEGAPPTQLPPELQQILMSLPENVKKYILSLPVEQQIVELQKVAQGQMQATQNSPNQMMQQQMNTPPQGQPQEQMPMGKYGGKFQTGGYKGKMDNAATKKYNDMNSFINKIDSIQGAQRNANMNNRQNLPYKIEVLPGETFEQARKRKVKEGIKPIPNYNPNTPSKRVYLAAGGIPSLSYLQALNTVPGKKMSGSDRVQAAIDRNNVTFKKHVSTAAPVMNPQQTQGNEIVKGLNQAQQDYNKVKPQNTGYNTNIPEGHFYPKTPAPTAPPYPSQFKKGDKMTVNGEVKIIEEYNGVLGYKNKDAIFTPINIAKSTPVTTGRNVTGNIGFTDVTSAKTNTIPPAQKDKVKPPYVPPAKTTPPTYNTPSRGVPGGQTPPMDIPRYSPIGPKPVDPDQPPISNPRNAGPYTPGGGTIRVQPAKPEDYVSPFKNDNSPFTKPATGSGVNYMNPNDLTTSKATTPNINLADLDKKIAETKQNIDFYKSKYEQMRVDRVANKNTTAVNNAYNNYKEAEKRLQMLEAGKNRYAKKQYGGKLYRSGGNTKLQYGSSARIPEDELDPLYKDYMQNVRGSGINQRQVDKSQKRYDRFDRREKRRTDGTFLDRWAKQRRNKQAGKIAMNENQRDVDAFNAQAAANDIGTISGYPMRPITAPNVAPKPTVTTPQSLRNNPSSVVTPSNATTNTVAPRGNTLPKGNGLARGGTQAVADYQKMLNEKHGTNLKIDGAWGPKTQAAYENFIKGSGKSAGNNSGGGNGSGGGSNNPNPNNPTTTTPSTTVQGPAEQPFMNKIKQEVGEAGRGIMSIAEKLDPGYWLSKGLEGAGMSKKWADRLGTVGSVASLFIPGLGMAGMVGRGMKVGSMAAKAGKAVKAVDAAADAGKVAQKALTYGPKMGETFSRLSAKAGNLGKQAVSLAPGTYQAGAAGDAWSNNRNGEALARIAGAGILGGLGIRNVRGVNKTSKMRNEMSNYRNLVDPKTGKKVTYFIDDAGKGTRVNPQQIPTKSKSYEGLMERGADKNWLGYGKSGSKPIIPQSMRDNPGTYGDDIGNMMGKAGEKAKGLYKGAKDTTKSLYEGAKDTSSKLIDKVRKKPIPKVETLEDVLTKGGAKPSGKDAWTFEGKIYSTEEAKRLAEMFKTKSKPKYGGQIYKNGGKILKSGGKMKYNTCKYGC